MVCGCKPAARAEAIARARPASESAMTATLSGAAFAAMGGAVGAVREPHAATTTQAARKSTCLLRQGNAHPELKVSDAEGAR